MPTRTLLIKTNRTYRGRDDDAALPTARDATHCRDQLGDGLGPVLGEAPGEAPGEAAGEVPGDAPGEGDCPPLGEGAAPGKVAGEMLGSGRGRWNDCGTTFRSGGGRVSTTATWTVPLSVGPIGR